MALRGGLRGGSHQPCAGLARGLYIPCARLAFLHFPTLAIPASTGSARGSPVACGPVPTKYTLALPCRHDDAPAVLEGDSELRRCPNLRFSHPSLVYPGQLRSLGFLRHPRVPISYLHVLAYLYHVHRRAHRRRRLFGTCRGTCAEVPVRIIRVGLNPGSSASAGHSVATSQLRPCAGRMAMQFE